MSTLMPARSVAAGPFLHPLHALLLAFPIALFATAFVNDIAYLNTAEMQWSNFAAWAIAGALVFGAPVVLWAAVLGLRYRSLPRYRTMQVRTRAATYLILVATMWVAGLIDAFQHSRDAWSSVGIVGLVLSGVSMLCAVVAGWIGHATFVNTAVNTAPVVVDSREIEGEA